MALKSSSSSALLLSLNLLFFFSFVNSSHINCNSCGRPKTPPSGLTPGGTNTPPSGMAPGGGTNRPPSGTTPGGGTNTPPSGTTPSSGRCPRDALKLGVCVDLLNGLINVVVGTPPTLPCCSLIQGLVDLEAAVCLCTAIRANILGINLNIPLSLSLLLNTCGRTVPRGFQCP